MEQQIAQTLWLPPGMCLLNPVPTMQFQPTSAIAAHHQMTSQFVKQQQMITVPATNLIQSPHYLQQAHILPSPAQNIIHIPGIPFDNLLLPSTGKQPYEIQQPLMEIPQCQTLNLQPDKQMSLAQNATLFPTEASFQRHFMTTKVIKKKRISPSAKRRSRLRLIAFLESKKKQQNELLNSSDENTMLQAPDHAYPDDATTPPSSDDVTLSPGSSSS
uniref:uncharacterized protein LOC120342243 n=1 Tax=Styela clava TaxID=7725 RepID=UPI00193AC61F|nr:uncharacterized protein LOC120342243 [Styela clava]